MFVYFNVCFVFMFIIFVKSMFSFVIYLSLSLQRIIAYSPSYPLKYVITIHYHQRVYQRVSFITELFLCIIYVSLSLSLSHSWHCRK